MSADKIDKLYQNYDILNGATEKSEVGAFEKHLKSYLFH